MSSAGTAYVDIEAKLDGFASDIDAAVSAVDAQVDVTANVDEAQGEIDGLNAEPIDVQVGAEVDEAQGEIDSLEGSPVDVPVKADTAEAQKSLDDLSGSMGALADAAGVGGGNVGGLASELAELGGASSAATIGLAGLAGGLGFAVDAAAEAEVASAQLANILETTGAGAYVTQESLQGLASEIQAYSGQSDEAIQQSETLLLTFAGLSNEASISAGILERATVATADIAALMGGDAASSALRLGRALDDPVAGMSMLQRSGVSFTEAQKEMIQGLYESGDALGAQSALLDVVEGQVGGAAEAYGDTFAGSVDKAKESLGDFAETVGGYAIPLLGDIAEKANEAATSLNALDVSSGESLMEFKKNAEDALLMLTPFGQVPFGIRRAWDALIGSNDEIRATGEVIGELPPELRNTEDAAYEAAAAIDDLTGSIDDYVASIIDVPGAQRDVQQSIADLTETMADSESSFFDMADAQDDVVTSTANLIQKMVEQGASNAALGTTIDNTIGMLRSERDAGHITQQQFADLTAEIRGIPTKAETAVSAPGLHPTYLEATNYRHLMNDVDGDTVISHWVADGLNRIYMDSINYRAIMNDLDGRTITTYSKHVDFGSPIRKNARGTESAAPGLSWVGEEGPELIALHGGERIWSHPESMALARSASNVAGVGASITVNVHGTATQADGQAVVDALRRWQQHNGPVPVKVSA